MLLTLLLIPFITSLLLMIIPRGNPHILKGIAISGAFLMLGVTIMIAHFFSPEMEFQFALSTPWIKSLKASFYIGIDTPALLLLLLNSTLFILVTIFVSAKKQSLKLYLILLLIGEGAITGVLISLDLILFYFFWEMMLVPFYLLIGIFGGKKRRQATLKFLIYTLGGSLLILAALILIYPYIQSYSIHYLTLHTIPSELIPLIFGLIFFGFAVKIPVLPIHNWLPDAHVEAPTEVSVLLAGILLKLGVFALIRFLWPLFPDHLIHYMPYIATLGITALIYGALLSWAQKDLKKAIAYSSISHLGTVLFALVVATPESTAGGLIMMITHGCSAALLFIITGIIKDRYHSKQLPHLGGIALKMPWLNRFMLFGMLAAIALPFTGNFVAEFMIFSSTYALGGTIQILTLIAMGGLFINTLAMLRIYHQTMSGTAHRNHPDEINDITFQESVPLTVLSFILLWIGIFPGKLMSMMEPWIKGNTKREARISLIDQNKTQIINPATPVKTRGKQI